MKTSRTHFGISDVFLDLLQFLYLTLLAATLWLVALVMHCNKSMNFHHVESWVPRPKLLMSEKWKEKPWHYYLYVLCIFYIDLIFFCVTFLHIQTQNSKFSERDPCFPRKSRSSENVQKFKGKLGKSRSRKARKISWEFLGELWNDMKSPENVQKIPRKDQKTLVVLL